MRKLIYLILLISIFSCEKIILIKEPTYCHVCRTDSIIKVNVPCRSNKSIQVPYYVEIDTCTTYKGYCNLTVFQVDSIQRTKYYNIPDVEFEVKTKCKIFYSD